MEEPCECRFNRDNIDIDEKGRCIAFGKAGDKYEVWILRMGLDDNCFLVHRICGGKYLAVGDKGIH